MKQSEAFKKVTDYQFIDSIPLGPWTSYSLLHDPKHMSFVLARYKFCSKIFEGKDNILEIGTGDSFGTPIIAQGVKDVIAIDTESRLIEGNKLRLSKIDNILFKTHNICEDPIFFKGRMFDGIFSIDVIEHLDQELEGSFMINSCKSLKDVGICVVGTPNKSAQQYAVERSSVQHINLYSYQSLKTMMKKYFHNVLMFGMNDEVVHMGYPEMMHYLFAVGGRESMKLSDYVIKFISDLGVKHIFLISGGAAVHLVDSISKNPNIDYICNNHEQACAMAADGYSRVSGNIGVAISTSGPGATNMLTGVCGAYYDSIPVLYITGQVTTFRLKGNSGVRQVGFQETNTVDIYKSVTKYAKMVRDPSDIKYELQKAVWVAKNGRPGPVLIDLPDDLQRADVDENNLRGFYPPKIESNELDLTKTLKLLKNASKPVVVLGWGVKLSKAKKEAKEFIEKLNFPVLQTWAVADIFPYNHPLNAGFFGQHGTKYGNLAIQNADLLLVLGSRLDTHMTGSLVKGFAPNAKKIMVDIDGNEIRRTRRDVGIVSDIIKFIDGINKEDFEVKDVSSWREKIEEWKLQYPICPSSYYSDSRVNPYVFFRYLSSCLQKDDIIITDTGSALAWFMQSFNFDGQRLFSDFNNTAMGWALPAAIGAFYASGKKIIAIGDGALQMNIQELSTIKLRNIPIKIFVINNKGYSMIRQTQDDWLSSKYEASTYETIGCPDFAEVAKAYGIRSLNISSRDEILSKIMETVDGDDPTLCNVNIPDYYRVSPVVKFGQKLEEGSY